MTTLEKPQALLLDFGGVVVATTKKPDWVAGITKVVCGLLNDAGVPADILSEAEIAHDIRAGSTGVSHWKNSMSRPYAPREITYAEYWGDFIAADWPEEARAVVLQQAEELCRVLGHLRQGRTIRAGIVDLITLARREGVKVGIVSNALSGQVHREFLASENVSQLFDVEIYSDEVAVRKPNPHIIKMAADRLGVEVSRTWYVGDNFDRDAVCGARAGVGQNILMESGDTYELPFKVRQQPDRVVPDGNTLLELFKESLRHDAVQA